MSLPMHLLIQSNFNGNSLTSGHPMGHGRMGYPCSREEGVFHASRARAQVVMGKRNGRTSEQPAHPETKTLGSGSQLWNRGCQIHSPYPSSPSCRVSPAFPWALSLGCVSNAAECRARLPAAVWRGAIACLFSGCLPALLLHASGFLAVVVLVLLLLNGKE